MPKTLNGSVCINLCNVQKPQRKTYSGSRVHTYIGLIDNQHYAIKTTIKCLTYSTWLSHTG